MGGGLTDDLELNDFMTQFAPKRKASLSAVMQASTSPSLFSCPQRASASPLALKIGIPRS